MCGDGDCFQLWRIRKGVTQRSLHADVVILRSRVLVLCMFSVLLLFFNKPTE